MGLFRSRANQYENNASIIWLGLCPQHNVLFDEMTVLEHLQFFGRVSKQIICKGLVKPDLRPISSYLLS